MFSSWGKVSIDWLQAVNITIKPAAIILQILSILLDLPELKADILQGKHQAQLVKVAVGVITAAAPPGFVLFHYLDGNAEAGVYVTHGHVDLASFLSEKFCVAKLGERSPELTLRALGSALEHNFIISWFLFNA